MQGNLPPGISLALSENLREWQLDIQVFENPIYPDGEQYRLRFVFSPSYPIEAPEVTFMAVSEPQRKIPLHPHVYSNGIICLDLLDRQGWSPAHNVESVCISIQSMLASNTKQERKNDLGFLQLCCYKILTYMTGPPGDEEFVRTNRQRPKDINFMYHDPSV